MGSFVWSMKRTPWSVHSRVWIMKPISARAFSVLGSPLTTSRLSGHPSPLSLVGVAAIARVVGYCRAAAELAPRSHREDCRRGVVVLHDVFGAHFACAEDRDK